MPESGFAIKDLAGFSEPAGKLIEALRAATGVLYAPTHLRRMARAESDASVIKAETDLKIKALEKRAARRVQAQEVRRQENIEAVVDGATKELPANVTAQRLDEDWTAEFFNNCQDVSDSKMQLLWSRILAGEFASPGKFSARTLNFVKLLTKKDAEMFTEFCSVVWGGSDMACYLKTDATEAHLTSNGLDFNTQLHLESLGLISLAPNLVIHLHQPMSKLHYFDKMYMFVVPTRVGPRISVPCVSLTSIGRELLALCNRAPMPGYVETLASSLKATMDIDIHPVVD